MEAGVRRRAIVAGLLLGMTGPIALKSMVLAQTRPGAPAAPPPAAGIDLNSASRDELMTLEGIGEVKADAIIRSRPFKVKTELVERRIITEALYDKINGRVMVRAVPVPAPAAPTQRR
jgi:DNA uptake protein ComE-like DNA-binding protein